MEHTREHIEKIAEPARGDASYYPETNQTNMAAGPLHGWENRYSRTGCYYDKRAYCDARYATWLVAMELEIDFNRLWEAASRDLPAEDYWTGDLEEAWVNEVSEDPEMWSGDDFIGEFAAVPVWDYGDWSKVLDAISKAIGTDKGHNITA